MRSNCRSIRGNLFAIFFLILVACTQNQEVFTAITAVPPTSLPAIATKAPTATALPPSPAKQATNTPQPTETVPTHTPTLLPTPVSCLDNFQANNLELPNKTGLLRVLYTVYDQYWLWQEETETAVALPIFRENLLVVSPNGLNYAFTRTSSEHERELWVIDNDGRNERNIATLSTAETLARYPDEGNENFEVGLAYWWGNNHTILYRLSPQLFIGGVAKEAIYLVDIDTGVSQMVLPPGEYSPDFKLSPDNLHAVALTADFAELHLINLVNNQVQLELSATSPILTFSPDGRYLLLPSQDGATIVDLVDFSQRSIPFPYRGIGVPGGARQPAILLDR